MAHRRSLGAHPDFEDERDYTCSYSLNPDEPLPSKVNLQKKMPPIYNQGKIGSCTANSTLAAYSMLALREDRVVNDDIQSRLFQYYNTRVLEGKQEVDSGASIRNSIKALNKFGTLPEEFWIYDSKKVCTRPPERCYQKALEHRALAYERVPVTEYQWKSALVNNDVVVFGMEVFSGMMTKHASKTGFVHSPGPEERREGCHAVCLVGYDDDLVDSSRPDVTGFFVVRNSWGESWGQKGHFFLPYTYLSHCFDSWKLSTVD